MHACMHACMYVRMYVRTYACNVCMFNWQWGPGFKSCLQQRNTTCLLSIWISLACARASKLTTTNMYVCMYVCMHACMYVCMGRAVEFKFLAWSSASIQCAGDLVSETLMGSNPAFSRGRQLVSFSFQYRLSLQEHRNKQKQTWISPEPGVNAKRQWGRVGWMLADQRDGLSSSTF